MRECPSKIYIFGVLFNVMSIENLAWIDSCWIPLIPEKVRPPKEICISFYKTEYGHNYRIALGNQRIFDSDDENTAREDYEGLKSAIEKVDYELVFYPSLSSEIKFRKT